MAEEGNVRPTKKQRQLLQFIEAFIAGHGYSPSYREIMHGLDYTSVATVALHVGNLIRRGHLRKRDRSARSIELVVPSASAEVTSNVVEASQEKWLVEQVEHRFKQAEDGAVADPRELEDLAILLSAMRILGMEGATQSFLPRLSALHKTLPVA